MQPGKNWKSVQCTDAGTEMLIKLPCKYSSIFESCPVRTSFSWYNLDEFIFAKYKLMLILSHACYLFCLSDLNLYQLMGSEEDAFV